MPNLTKMLLLKPYTTKLRPSHFSNALKDNSQAKSTQLWKVCPLHLRIIWLQSMITIMGTWSTKMLKLSESLILQNWKELLIIKSLKSGSLLSKQINLHSKENHFLWIHSRYLRWWADLQLQQVKFKKPWNLLLITQDPPHKIHSLKTGFSSWPQKLLIARKTLTLQLQISTL